LSEIAGVNAGFLIASAEMFSRPEEFGIVLHFGTLYHLANPVLSPRASFDNLRPGGDLALETQVYDHPEDANICYFMHMQNNDATNFWALNRSALTKCLELVGFREINSTAEDDSARARSLHAPDADQLNRPEARKTICAALCSPRYKGEAVRLRLKSRS
jgi:Protein of unknown function (DUF1698)